MKLRKLLGVAAGTVGTAALANRVLASRAEEVEPFLPGSHHTYRWRGFDVSYTEAGDPEDRDLVLLHGLNAAGSSHEFHAVFETLAEEYHVIAPDMPGFGLSDRPPLLYSASLLSTFVREFIEDKSQRPVVVASSLTGAYAAAAAREADVERLVLVCPTDTSMGGRRTWVRSLLRSPVVGEALYNLTVSKAGLRYFHSDHGYYDMRNLEPAVLEYEWQIAHRPGARFAPASFVGGFLDTEEDLGAVLSELTVPMTLVWGREADVTPLPEGQELAERAEARLVVFDDALLLPHVEHPEAFVEVVRGRHEAIEA